MKILHISDWHSRFQNIPEDQDYDLIVCSGDLLPNRSRGNVKIERAFQPIWVEKVIDSFIKLIGDRPFVFCSGNHDFIDPCPILQKYGLNAINIDFCKKEIAGLSFYGLPLVPYLDGEWNHEKRSNEIQQFCSRQMKDQFPVDILVAHCPLYGYLDNVPWSNRPRLGNSVLTNLFFYGSLEWPKMILSGHIHEGNGIVELDECILSNAACGYRILEI